ncbi:hypothetical protein P43SY_007174 [Pythium insidiosum]|uniref:Uncharacterized protein n=1 Tax=Pythium insidiosum TaxID=114742 RepID=A0AAD5QAA5_PYTIN|nr:hypothetical protein P43SY_007174 [Pythium insidiosum]
MSRDVRKLTADEELFLQSALARIEAYFHDFEELEGFSVLTTNVQRLYRKVALELRSIVFEYHDSFEIIAGLREKLAANERENERQQALCDQVITESQALITRLERLKVKHADEMQRLHAFYEAQEELLRKQLAIEFDAEADRRLQAIQKEANKRLELMEAEHSARLEAARQQLESKKQDEVEYMRVQLRMQLTSQISRDLGKRLARQEKLCERHKKEIQQLQSKIRAEHNARIARQ